MTHQGEYNGALLGKHSFSYQPRPTGLSFGEQTETSVSLWSKPYHITLFVWKITKKKFQLPKIHPTFLCVAFHSIPAAHDTGHWIFRHHTRATGQDDLLQLSLPCNSTTVFLRKKKGNQRNRSFLRGVMSAISMKGNKEMANIAISEWHIPLGIELRFHANVSLCCEKSMLPLITWLKVTYDHDINFMTFTKAINFTSSGEPRTKARNLL